MKKYTAQLMHIGLALLVGASFAFAAENTFQVQLAVIPEGNTAPSVPANLVATAVSSSQIDLSWDTSTDDVAVDGYRIFRDGIVVASTTALTYSDIGLTASTAYTYEVEAFDTAPLYSGLSAPATATTLAVGVTPPGPGGQSGDGQLTLILSNINATPAQRSAVVSFSTNQATQAKVYWGTTAEYELGSISGLFYDVNHAVTIDSLVPGTQYFFRVEVVNSIGAMKSAEGSFETLSVVQQEVLTNVTGFKATPRTSDIALSWKNPSQSIFDSVRIVRSDKFFPRDIYDGQVVYEGRAQNHVDADVRIGTTYYYTIFARDTAGNYSSGALAKARIAPAGEIVISPDSTDPFIGIPVLENVDPGIARLTLLDFDFFQEGKKLVNIGNQIGIDGSKDLTIRLEYGKVPEILKTIAITLADPEDPTQVFPFLLRVNQDKTAYEATIAPLGKRGKYKMNIVILDYKNQGLRRLDGNLRAFVFGSIPGLVGARGGVSYRVVDLFFLLVALIMILLAIAYRRHKKTTQETYGV
ncbi:MAG: hypothetical protein AAB365_00780 [Patescibacteria group bacterium]